MLLPLINESVELKKNYNKFNNIINDKLIVFGEFFL